MEISEILNNEYFGKILLSLIPILLKGLFSNGDESKSLKRILGFLVNYGLPAGIIIWINFDENIESNKLTTTIIGYNLALILFTFLQQKLNGQYKLITQFTNVETDKIKQINNINNTQVEKIHAINDNQKYILSELSKINDRIIRYFGDK
jgi:hypothetical protein